ncbi:cytochrome P450 family protein [Mycobacterium spongiae]|uniref:Cytochrome P450 n=1 Tax=Mycobacterium spongiae TaxID=886343 RepID=A0A975JZX1_9MYCO|nr:cytochrome P450 [Mycobacterium spongiae]QUR68134.1 cytochrome P450 [Mycobacterium spongiae]
MSTTQDMPTGESIQLESPDFLADPFGVYDHLRRNSPVHRATMSYIGNAELYVLARYHDCVDLTTDPRFRRVVEGAEPPPVPQAIRFLSTDSMIYKDDPEHLRLRNLVSRAFTPKAIATLTDRVEAVTSELLDGFRRGQQIELITDYALPIPVTVISEMVGVDESDRARFHDGMKLIIDGVTTYDLEALAAKFEDLIDFLRGVIDRRRAEPADDIMTGLIHASQDGDRLTDDELVAMVFLLISAGYETTYNLISNGVAALLTHPDQLELLITNPELIGSAVEEILRYTGTIGGTKPNYATEDVEWHGVHIPRGAMVVPLLASANRDPAVFDRPEVFDITRSPNYHIAFSKGPHFCLGANLARMETRIAIGNLIARFPDLTLAVDPSELQYVPVPLWRRLTRLPITLR